MGLFCFLGTCDKNKPRAKRETFFYLAITNRFRIVFCPFVITRQ